MAHSKCPSWIVFYLHTGTEHSLSEQYLRFAPFLSQIMCFHMEAHMYKCLIHYYKCQNQQKTVFVQEGFPLPKLPDRPSNCKFVGVS